MKLYLFDKEFQEPLRNYLVKNKNMSLHPVNSKLSGLQVLAPCSIEQKSDGKKADNDDGETLINEQMIE